MEEQAAEYRYEFTITGISAEDSRDLMDLVLEFVESCGGSLGGGLIVVEETDGDKEEPKQLV